MLKDTHFLSEHIYGRAVLFSLIKKNTRLSGKWPRGSKCCLSHFPNWVTFSQPQFSHLKLKKKKREEIKISSW